MACGLLGLLLGLAILGGVLLICVGLAKAMVWYDGPRPGAMD